MRYITAMPRMQHYIDVSAEIYGIYLQMIAPEDIYVYSIDECFINVAPYLNLYKRNGRVPHGYCPQKNGDLCYCRNRH